MRVAWGSLAVAGALALAGWGIHGNGGGPSRVDPEWNMARRAVLAGKAGDPATSLATLATLPDRATGQMEQWLAAAMGDPQWAYLGHDAHLVAQWLVEDLPWRVPAEDAE